MKKKFEPNISKATGKDLDAIGLLAGVKRRRYWWIFRESNRAFRLRIARAWLGPDSLVKID